MKRILLIVIWFFIFAFLSGVAGIVFAISLDIAGFESTSDFFWKKVWPTFFIVTMLLGLSLGLYGFLPGTKQKHAGNYKLQFENKGLKYLVLRVGLGVILLLVTMPIGEGVIWLINFKAFNWIGFPIGIFYVFSLSWFANKTAEHMAFEGQNMLSAMRFTLGDLRLRLAFLPVVGSWFISDSGKRDDDKEDKN